MTRRSDYEYDADIYGDPDVDYSHLTGMGWVRLTPEQRAAYRAPVLDRRLAEAIQKVIDGWALP